MYFNVDIKSVSVQEVVGCWEPLMNRNSNNQFCLFTQISISAILSVMVCISVVAVVVKTCYADIIQAPLEHHEPQKCKKIDICSNHQKSVSKCIISYINLSCVRIGLNIIIVIAIGFVIEIGTIGSPEQPA